MRMSMTQSMPCPACGAHSGHHTGCPSAALDYLTSRQRHIHCPKCGEYAIDVNQGDYYECRVCHTLYSTGFADSHNPEKTFLDDPRLDDLIIVSVLQKKGEGRFSIDQAIKKAQKNLREAIKKNSKK